MKKILVFLLVFCMLLSCGCQDAEKPAAEKEQGGQSQHSEQYVIALNPSVMLEDGTVLSIRNGAASIMADDLKNETASLYDSTPWQWLTHTDNGEWNRRLVRELSLWTNKNGSPYAYMTDDARLSSIAVYDSSQMDVKGFADGELPQSGVLMSFTGKEEEAICYTATADGLVELADRNGGKISLVKSVAGVSTDNLDKDNVNAGIVLKIYVNNRIYWQEVLTADKTAVDFPVFTNLELTAGNSILLTAQATEAADTIACGNCDIPADTITITESIKQVNKVEYMTTEPEKTEIPFVLLSECPFLFVTPEKMSDKGREITDSFLADVSKVLDVSVNSATDDSEPNDEYMILIGDTSFKESKDAIAEIKAGRTNHGADFIIRFVNNKLVIAAENDISLKFAMEFFLKNYCTGEKATLKTDINYVSSKYNSFKDIKIAGTSISNFRIVVSRFGSLLDFDAAEYLSERILRLTGVGVPVVRDGEKATANEILIGNTNRTSSTHSTVSTKSVSDSYTIKVSGGKLSITGGSTSAVNAGTIALTQIFENTKSFANGYSYSGKYNGQYSLTDGYKLTWADEFNGTELSKTWATSYSSNPSVYGGLAYTSKDNSFVEDGNLVQRMERDGNDVIEADINSEGAQKTLFKYGYFEARIKLADSEGSWGALWHCGEVGGTYMAEIDTFENFGNLYNVKSNAHVWWGEYHENVLGGGGNILNYSPGTTTLEPYSDNYHTIAFEWEPSIIKFYVDGILTQTFTWDSSIDPQYDCFDKPVNIILSHWGGRAISSFSNCILPEGFTETNIYYDYIRIYQKEDNGSVIYVKK